MPRMHRVKQLEIIETVSAVTGKPQRRRLVILQRKDGNFSFAEEYFYTSEDEGKIIAEGWQQLPSNGIYDSVETAEAEGRAAFAQWYART
jgi:hypothetical protein